MKKIYKKSLRKIRKKRAKKIIGNNEIPRVVMSESNKYIIAQAINDIKGETIIYESTHNFSNLNDDDSKEKKNKISKKNTFYLEKLIKLFSKKMIEEKKFNFIFDRNGRIFKGKTSIFCNGLKKEISDFLNNNKH